MVRRPCLSCGVGVGRVAYSQATREAARTANLNSVQAKNEQAIGGINMSVNQSHQRLCAKERQQRALALRRAGHSYDSIAQELGYRDRSGPYRAVAQALEVAVMEEVQQLRVLESQRLDALLEAVWPQAAQGVLPAVDRAVRILERRARLLGLDAPQQNEVLTIDRIDNEIERLRRELQSQGIDS